MYGQSDLGFHHGTDFGFHHGTDFHGDFSLNLTGMMSGAGQRIGEFFGDNPELAPSLLGAGAGIASGIVGKRAAEQQAELQAQLYAEQMRIEEARRKANMQLLFIGLPLIGLTAFILIRARKK